MSADPRQGSGDERIAKLAASGMRKRNPYDDDAGEGTSRVERRSAAAEEKPKKEKKRSMRRDDDDEDGENRSKGGCCGTGIKLGPLIMLIVRSCCHNTSHL